MSRSEGQNSGLAQSGLWVKQFGGSRFACMAYVGSYGLGLGLALVWFSVIGVLLRLPRSSVFPMPSPPTFVLCGVPISDNCAVYAAGASFGIFDAFAQGSCRTQEVFRPFTHISWQVGLLILRKCPILHCTMNTRLEELQWNSRPCLRHRLGLSPFGMQLDCR